MATPPMFTQTSPGSASEDSKLDHDFKRDADHRHKWALGKLGEDDGFSRTIPVTPVTSKVRTAIRRQYRYPRKPLSRIEPELDSNASSPGEESYLRKITKEASTSPEPDAGITYSYDAPRGPGQGSEILSLAINKAVERFETKVTEKLVKDEYEVVAHDKEAGNIGRVAEEDDFQLI
ncbi:hypothetical protein MMC14_001711 [Varicellaria rhodocarpa]|nr:hypothetical protein [Varicellaria rhodocarpa]